MINWKFIKGKFYRRIEKYLTHKTNLELENIIEELMIDVTNIQTRGCATKAVIICNELLRKGTICHDEPPSN